LPFSGKSFVLFCKLDYYCAQDVKIYYLKKLLLILSFIGFLNLHSQAQNRENPGGTTATIVKFYPNPATTVINFDFQKAYDKGYSIQIYSFMGGKKMYELPNIANRTTINLSDFNRGVYIYQLRDKTGRLVESGKFQVSK
jgi:hypothetical protein